ncbi:MAG: HI0074 family nucleotidyltransferase substrate-binding subunit [Bdellovibrionales bacterium]
MSVSVEEYNKALLSFDEALTAFKKPNITESERKLFRDASIQRFEFCVELAWKVSKKQMGTVSTAPKTVIREMAQAGLINDPELWFEFLEARNLSSHSYDEDVAKKIQNIFNTFYTEAQKLLKNLSK